jgi:hypothetical protein
MSKRRLTTFGLLAPLVASLLILGMVAAELPELLSLVDDTSNDFVVQNASHGSSTSTAVASSHCGLTLEAKNYGPEARQEGAAGFVPTEVVTSELFLLYSVLRR